MIPQTFVDNRKEIIKFFGVSPFKKGNINVPCPFHNDLEPSASLNLEKGLFHCFKRCTGSKGGLNFKQLSEKLLSTKHIVPMEEEKPKMIETTNANNNGHGKFNPTVQAYKKFIRSRGISESTIKLFKAYPELDKNKELAGYLVFPYDDDTKYIARDFLNIQEHKHLVSQDKKGLYNFQKGKFEELFLVEGIFDLLSMWELGYKNVICGQGSILSEHQAYLLRKTTIYILFDADFAGWNGSIETSKILASVGANPIILELPEVGNKNKTDINDIYVSNKRQLKSFVSVSMSKYNITDRVYVNRLFNGEEKPLNKIPTGIRDLDAILGGGIVEGMNAIWGETGNTKSFFCLYLALVFAQKGKKVLYDTTEISVRQCWARVASHYSKKRSWQEIEEFPEKIEDSAKKKISELATNLKIVAGWKLSEIKRTSKNYDVIIVDYIQRMPGFTDQDLTNINMNLSGLSDIARDEAKAVIVVSSINRASYDKSDSISAGKGSGNIEFMVQVLGRLEKIGDKEVDFRLLKNTRGASNNNAIMKVNLNNLMYK